MIPPKRRKILALICIYYFSVFITLGRKNAASEWANLRLVNMGSHFCGLFCLQPAPRLGLSYHYQTGCNRDVIISLLR
ncbi:hypothetical protein GZD89_000075 [Shigella flexneri]|nr:hypothetical protein [Shigella flexneri]